MTNSIRDVLREVTWKKHGKHAVFWLIVTLITSAIPTLMAWAAMAFSNTTVKFANFFVHGEFTIYCVGLLTVSLVTIGRELKVGFPNRPSFILLGSIGLLAAAGFHGLIVGANASSAEAGTFNVGLTLAFSIVVYVYSITLAFFVTLVNAYREDMNLEQLLRAPTQRLDERFEHLRKTDAEENDD